MKRSFANFFALVRCVVLVMGNFRVCYAIPLLPRNIVDFVITLDYRNY